MKRKTIVMFFLIRAVLRVFAQTGENGGQTVVSALKLDFPLFDLPYQIDAMNAAGYGFFSSYSILSMEQSIALTTDVYSAMHFGLVKMRDALPWASLYKNIAFYTGTAAGIFTFAYLVPFGYPWLYKEYQRALFARREINSDWWPAGFGVIDNELAFYKEESPAEFVRLYSAKSEAYLLFSDNMLRRRFFYDLHDLSVVTAFLPIIYAFGDMSAVLTDGFFDMSLDADIKDLYNNEGNQKSRKLAYYPAINWVYDLFRPDEPFGARGSHPSGDGVARHIMMAQLTEDEKDYLIKQGYLGLLNFVSPLLFGYNSFFSVEKIGLDGNFAIRHYLTSFGTDTPVQILLKKNPLNLIFTWHNYQNYQNYFPAVEVELIDFPLSQILPASFFEKVYASPRVLIGMQPEDQIFKTAEPEFMGLFGLRLDFAVTKNIFPYIEVTAKTGGWVAGNEYLENNVSVIMGISMRF
jgi:hypothetical protein